MEHSTQQSQTTDERTPFVILENILKKIVPPKNHEDPPEEVKDLEFWVAEQKDGYLR